LSFTFAVRTTRLPVGDIVDTFTRARRVDELGKGHDAPPAAEGHLVYEAERLRRVLELVAERGGCSESS